MNPEIVAKILSRLQLLKFFPDSEDTLEALVRNVGTFAETEDQVEWLVDHILRTHNDWPGPIELRAIFCSRFKPKDGFSIARSCDSPGAVELKKTEVQYPRLKPGDPVTQDLTINASMYALGELKDMNRVTKAPRVASIPVAEGRITQADINRAVAENRDKKARLELGMKEEEQPDGETS